MLSLKNQNDKIQYLQEISTSYLYKDVLELSNIKHPSKIHDLLRLLAFQIGSQVSITELSQSLQINKNTVAHYIDMLEKAFVIFRLGGFSRNLRKETTKMDKIYFYDLGIRNIIIGNLNDLSHRDDTGKLWENFLISERVKLLCYHLHPANSYFWRTYTGAELDYVEEYGGQLFGYEFKWKRKLKKPPPSWSENYPQSHYQSIDQDNYLDFILSPSS